MDDQATADGPVAPPAAPGPTTAVPFWLLRLGALGWRVLVVATFVLVLVLLAAALGTVTASIAVAALAAATLAPLVTRLRARGMGGGLAAALGTLLVFGTIVAVLAVGAWVLIRFGPELLAAVTDGLDELRGADVGGWLPGEVARAIADLVDGSLRWLVENVGRIVGDVASLVTVLLFGAFTTFYVLQDFGSGWRWLTQGMSGRQREAATASVRTATLQIGGYTRRIAVLAALEAAVILGLLLVLGVPLPVPLATLVFAGGFVPYLGGLVATGAVLLVALASIGPSLTALLLGLIVAANIVLDRLVAQPMARRSVRVNPAIVLVALPVGASVGGLFGLVMAVPVAAAVLAVGTSVIDIIRPEAPDDATRPALVPDWLDWLAQWCWRLLVGFALVAVALQVVLLVPVLVMPLIIAGVLAATFAPLVGWLIVRGTSRAIASGLVTVGATAVIAVVSILAVAALAANVGGLIAGIGDGAGAVDDWLGGLGGPLEGLVDVIGDRIGEAIVGTVLGLAGVAAVVAIGVILTFFLLRDGRAAWERLISLAAPWRRRELDRAGGEAVGILGSYMLGTGAVSLFGAATQWLLMVLLGVPLALPVFVLSFFGGFIPYIGSAITTGIALLLTITTGDTTAILVMLGFTAVFNVVQGNVVQPLVFSRVVHIHPAIVLLAIPAGGALGGIIGMFLVVPFLGVVAATWRTVLVVLGQPPGTEVDEAGSETTAEAAPHRGPGPAADPVAPEGDPA